MKKIPYGITNFKELIENNYYYVDKTMYLSNLERAGNVLVYLRPRSYGKTLFTSMISYYYDIASSDMFDELFKDTYVFDSPTPDKNNYYILKFDFSGMDIEIEDEQRVKFEFIKRIKSGIKAFVNNYNLNFKIKEEYDSPTTILTDFLDYFRGLK